MNTQDFINKAKSIHGDKYDYSKTEYVNSKTKVCIICPKHGEFWQEPRHHLFGQGCKLCGYERMKKKSRNTIDFFLKRAKETHNKNYDYSKVVYKGSETPVCIICPEHGEFWMTPHQFLKGSNCPKCSSRCKMDKQEFIKRATEKFGNKFNYDNVKVDGNRCYITLNCEKHGSFKCTPYYHLISEYGCPKCGLENTINPRKLNTEEFIKKANKIHGDTYKYDEVNYVDCNTKIKIICEKHGTFKQTPSKHLCGQGCPKCGMKYNKNELKILKILLTEFENVEYQKHLNKIINEENKYILDFYLPDYKIAIEYHGKQHFEPVSIFGGEEGCEITKKRDKEKYELCKKNGINIKYITFENILIENYLDKVYKDINEIIYDIKTINNG